MTARPQAAEGRPIPVVAAVRFDGERYWVCRRTATGRHGGLAGMWEYPGGKVEAGESMLEEFGVECDVGELVDAIVSPSVDGLYNVMFYRVSFRWTPTLRVHDQAGWFTPAELECQKHLPSGTEFNRRRRKGE